MRRNKYAPVVPCHRVVSSDLSLGGFSGSWVRAYHQDHEWLHMHLPCLMMLWRLCVAGG